MMIKEILLDKLTLVAENITTILSLVSFISMSTIFVSINAGEIELGILPLVFLSFGSIFSISLAIWFRFKPIFPKGIKTTKVRNIRYLIFGIAMLISLAQSGALTLLIIDDLEKINGNSLPSYTNEYRTIAFIVYEIITPVLYIVFSSKIIKQIKINNKLSEWAITKNLGWG